MAHAYIPGEVVSLLTSSLEHSGHEFVCNQQALRLECEADDVNALFWTSDWLHREEQTNLHWRPQECRVYKTYYIIYTEAPAPPAADEVNIKIVTEDSILLSINQDRRNNRWELWYYQVTVYDKDGNKLSTEKMFDTPIHISSCEDKIEYMKVVTVTLCNQRSPPLMVFMNRTQTVVGMAIPGPARGSGTSQKHHFSFFVLVVTLITNFV